MARRIEQGGAALSLTGTELLPGSQLSLTVISTGTDISADAATRKFIRASGSWITDGWAVGDSAHSQGWTGGTANNKTARTVEAVTALHLTFDATTGSDIVNDAGGEAITVTKWEPVAIPAADIAALAAPDASQVTYLPSSNTSWNTDADPGNVDDALDQLAVRTDLLEFVVTHLDASSITYTPSSNTTWRSDADPGNVDDALDQLAQRVEDIQGTGLDVDACGFRGIPQNSQSGNYTCVAADAGKHILHPSGGGAGDTITIPENGSVAYEIGTTITFVNRDSNSCSIAITTDTMYLANTTTTGTRTLAQNGVATAIKVESTVWIISGTGLT